MVLSIPNLITWDQLSLTDLVYAFRKAKVDCFYESSIRVSRKFATYEEDLTKNLSKLLLRLQAGDVDDVLSSGIEDPILFPKRLSTAPYQAGESRGHAFFSDAKRAFDKLSSRRLTPEFRMIGDFTVDCHIVSALWVNLIGHKFDARLSPRALASRVRRYRASKELDQQGEYHLEALGSFEPYFSPYRKWRDDGIKVMDRSIAEGNAIVALTLDVGNFYHSIDPRFFVDPRFLENIKLELTEIELQFSTSMSNALANWSARCKDSLTLLGCVAEDGATFGIPIGLSIVRIISNAILSFLDTEINTSLSPLYYARYVDDIFLVIQDNGELSSQEDVWDFISRRIQALRRDPETRDVSLTLPPWGGSTRICLQDSKQKCFFLKGRAGADLLANIASQIREVSSERRLMPLPEHLDQTQSAKALAATETADEADSLRRADGITLRRLGWSVLLRSVSTLARDLLPKDWIKERNNFYDFAHAHVIRPDKILEQLDHLPRLFSLAISLGDWKQARRIHSEAISALYDLQRATAKQAMIINGCHAPFVNTAVWDQTRTQVKVFFQEALIRSYSVNDAVPTAKAFTSLLKDLAIDVGELIRVALLARETDWARISYREHLRTVATRRAPKIQDEELLYGRYSGELPLRQFLDRSELPSSGGLRRRVPHNMEGTNEEASLLPFLFPTRPYTAEEIALYLPNECVFAEPLVAAENWAHYTRGVRGVWIRGRLGNENASSFELDPGEPSTSSAKPDQPDHVFVDGPERTGPVKLGITSFATSDQTWAKAASGSPDLTPARYKALARIVNQAINEPHRPDYLILPELSVPERWVTTISGRLFDSGINLIAGLDYVRHPSNHIDSSAVLVLSDKKLGHVSRLQIRQRKDLPSPGEEESLFSSHGQTWKPGEIKLKPIYVHNDFYFGVLICSELQNMYYRSGFQGYVDCMMILSWNKDLETFSALVDSAAFDVHAYIALVNNLRYGDSRVRRPAKQSHKRDLCRVRGGLNDQLVVVKIDSSNLRAQQSRAKRWPKHDDAYKPAPEGFLVSDERRAIPS